MTSSNPAETTGTRPRVADADYYDARLLDMVRTGAAACGNSDAMRAWLAAIGDDRASYGDGRTEIEQIALRGAYIGRLAGAAAELVRMVERIAPRLTIPPAPIN